MSMLVVWLIACSGGGRDGARSPLPDGVEDLGLLTPDCNLGLMYGADRVYRGDDDVDTWYGAGFYTTDGGNTWSRPEDGEALSATMSDGTVRETFATRGDRVVVDHGVLWKKDAFVGAVLKSTDGATWETVGTFPSAGEDPADHGLGIDVNGDKVLVWDSHSAYYSSDGGRTFEAAGGEAITADIVRAAVGPGPYQIAYSLREVGVVLVQGDTVVDGPSAPGIVTALASTESGRLYAGPLQAPLGVAEAPQSSLWWSDDWGGTWKGGLLDIDGLDPGTSTEPVWEMLRLSGQRDTLVVTAHARLQRFPAAPVNDRFICAYDDTTTGRHTPDLPSDRRDPAPGTASAVLRTDASGTMISAVDPDGRVIIGDEYGLYDEDGTVRSGGWGPLVDVAVHPATTDVWALYQRNDDGDWPVVSWITREGEEVSFADFGPDASGGHPWVSSLVDNPTVGAGARPSWPMVVVGVNTYPYDHAEAQGWPDSNHVAIDPDARFYWSRYGWIHVAGTNWQDTCDEETETATCIPTVEGEQRIWAPGDGFVYAYDGNDHGLWRRDLSRDVADWELVVSGLFGVWDVALSRDGDWLWIVDGGALIAADLGALPLVRAWSP